MYNIPQVFSTSIVVEVRPSSSRSSSSASRSVTRSPQRSYHGVDSMNRNQNRVSQRDTPQKKSQFNGITYNRAGSSYTNTSGIWVFYWLMYTNAQGNRELRCYDKDHKRTTCNKDSKSQSKDWY